MSDDEFVKLLLLPDDYEAELLQVELEAEEIPAVVCKPEHVPYTWGYFTCAELWVRRQDLQRAMQLVPD